MYKNISKIFLTVLLSVCYYIAAAHIGIASVKGTNCAGANTGEVQFIINGTAGPFQYSVIDDVSGNSVATGTVAQSSPDVITVGSLPKGQYHIDITNDFIRSCVKRLDFKVECCRAVQPPIEFEGVVDYAALSGSIKINLTGNSYYYLWTSTNNANFKATTKDLTNVPAGTYCLKVTNGTCEEATKCFQVGDCPESLIEKETVVGICNITAANGSITLVAGGGTAPYTFAWSNGATTAAISNLAKGSYQVTVTDSRKCNTIKPIEVSEMIKVTATPKNGCGEKGSIELNVVYQGTKTAASLNYIWGSVNTGFQAFTPNIYDLEEDIYNLVVSDGQCSTPVYNITITNSALDASVNVTPVNGSIKGAISLSLTGKAPLKYAFQNQPFVTGASANFPNLNAGLYSVTVTNGDGCSKVIPIKVLSCQFLDPATDFRIYPTVVSNCPFRVTFDYPAKGINGIITTLTNFTTDKRVHKNGVDKVARIKTNACIKLKVGDNLCDKFGSGEVLAEKCVEPQCDFVMSNAGTCNNRTLSILPSKNYPNPCTPITYEWEHVSSNASTVALAAPLTATKVTVTDANGCAQIKNFDFKPTSGVYATDICDGEGKVCIKFDFEGYSNPPYTVTAVRNMITNEIYTNVTNNLCNLKSSNYSITLTDGSGCTFYPLLTIPKIATPLKADYEVTPCSDNTTNNGIISFKVTSGTANISYIITNNQGFFDSGAISVASPKSYNNLAAGNYYLHLKDASGCTKTYIIVLYHCNQVTQSSNRRLIVSPTYDATGSICSTEPAKFNFALLTIHNEIKVDVTGAVPFAYSFKKYNVPIKSGVLANSPSSATLGSVNTGYYTFYIKDSRGCAYTYGLKVEDVTVSGGTTNANESFWKPEADVVHINSFCEKGSITLKNFPAKHHLLSTYNWKYPDGTSSTSRDLEGLNLEGTYSVTITDPTCNKKGTNSFILLKEQLIPLTHTVTNSCSATTKGCIKFDITPFTKYAPFKFAWKKANGVPLYGTSPDICNLDAGVYSVSITNKDGCTLTRSIEVKSVDFKLDFTFTITNATDCASTDGQINITTLTTTGGTAPVVFQWFKGNTAFAQGNNPILLKMLAAGNYSLVATDANGCSVTKPFVIGLKMKLMSLLMLQNLV